MYPSHQRITAHKLERKSVSQTWCIRASEPREPFTVPLVKQQVYADLESCQSEAGASDVFVVVDPDWCFAAAIATVSDERIAGGVQVSCNGEVLRIETFSDRKCSQAQDPEPLYPLLERSDSCSPTPREELYVTADCITPEIYCRPLIDGLGMGVRVGGDSSAARISTISSLGLILLAWAFTAIP